MRGTSAKNPLSGVEKTLGPELFQRIVGSKILLVGSGGIGCELLKNLALSGFRNVEVIDLDTIDVSNLNRQFLFRRQHVGMPKCEVACAAALAMSPPSIPPADGTTVSSTDCNGGGGGGGKEKKGKDPRAEIRYIAHHGNVCDNSRFNVQYISTFDLVLNALDNVHARRRVNRLCLAASVPLVEAGTTGYLGQITVIDRPSGVECYECQPKPTQKVYPICTIRSTPSMPVHTIVWAKELYKLCFGGNVEDSMLFEDQTQEGGETSVYMDLVLEMKAIIASDVKHGEHKGRTLRTVAGDLFVALYHTEIEKQLAMDRFKTAQKIPTPVPIAAIHDIAQIQGTPPPPPSQRDGYRPTNVLSMKMCIEELMDCFLEAATTLRATPTPTANDAPTPCLPEFDKDNSLAMRIVTYASNLRSYVFSIEPIQSYYSAKGIAGNIIPAIATTNAIVAGLQVLQAFHILRRRPSKTPAGGTDDEAARSLKDDCRYTYCLRDRTRKGFYLLPTTLPPPNPNCFVCRNAVVRVTLDTERWTLEMLLRRIIKRELGFMEPSLMVGDDIISEEGEGADAGVYVVNMGKRLVDLPSGGVRHGTVVVVEDFTQDLEVSICVSHCSVWEEKEGEEKEEEERFVVNKPNEGKDNGGSKPTGKAEDKCNGDGGDGDDDDDEIMIVSGGNEADVNLNKRALIIEDTVEDEDRKKRAKIGQ